MDNREAIRARLDKNGTSIADWAKQNGFKPRTVYAVIYGELKAKRGISHRIAVALGMKLQPQRPF